MYAPFFACFFVGGAGGKGTWGKLGQVYDENDVECVDSHDPNYDSENQV